MDSPKKLCLLSAIIYFMYSSTSDAACSLPDELKSSTWEYNYTQIIDSSEQSATISIRKTTMQTSVIYDVQGTQIVHWTCINSLNISNTQDVVVFRSDNSFTIGGPFGSNRWLYLCMKITKVTDDLFYFHILSDVFTDVTPNERFFSPDGSAPNHNGPTCSTFCQYTGSPKIRTLRKQETSDEIPFDAALCEPCDSACQLATTIMTPTATTQKQSIPPMSTATGTATPVIWIETTQNATKPSTSIEIDSTTDVITTGTTHKTSVKNTVSEILNHYTGLIIAGGLIISGLMVVIAIYCLIKKRQKDPSKYTSTNVKNEGEEKVSHIYSEPSEVYHEYSEPSEVYHEYSEPSEVYHEYSEPSRVYHVYRGRQHGYEETIFQE